VLERKQPSDLMREEGRRPGRRPGDPAKEKQPGRGRKTGEDRGPVPPPSAHRDGGARRRYRTSTFSVAP
jgi:hypothetical protein